MIEAGGRELLIEKDENGYTALHIACENENVSTDIISFALWLFFNEQP